MATTGPSKKYRKQPEICVKEELKIAVKIAIDRFRFEEKQKGKILDVYVIVNCCNVIGFCSLTTSVTNLKEYFKGKHAQEINVIELSKHNIYAMLYIIHIHENS